MTAFLIDECSRRPRACSCARHTVTTLSRHRDRPPRGRRSQAAAPPGPGQERRHRERRGLAADVTWRSFRAEEEVARRRRRAAGLAKALDHWAQDHPEPYLGPDWPPSNGDRCGSVQSEKPVRPGSGRARRRAVGLDGGVRMVDARQRDDLVTLEAGDLRPRFSGQSHGGPHET